jgi:poly(3-hydroxyalkanoate) synthetase
MGRGSANPHERFATKTFEDYMLEGPLAALTVIEQAVGEQEVNAIGYCLGGTLLASTPAQNRMIASGLQPISLRWSISLTSQIWRCSSTRQQLSMPERRMK